MHIRVDDLHGPEIAGLLATHLAFCRASSPPESTHALDLDALRAAGIYRLDPNSVFMTLEV